MKMKSDCETFTTVSSPLHPMRYFVCEPKQITSKCLRQMVVLLSIHHLDSHLLIHCSIGCVRHRRFVALNLHKFPPDSVRKYQFHLSIWITKLHPSEYIWCLEMDIHAFYMFWICTTSFTYIDPSFVQWRSKPFSFGSEWNEIDEWPVSIFY